MGTEAIGEKNQNPEVMTKKAVTKSIPIGGDVRLDLAKFIQSRGFIQGASGTGKSNLARWILEKSHPHIQQIVIDPEGEFSTLREKYDYVLVGPDGDLAADPRSAELLAIRLLELGASAILDLSELQQGERQRYVKLFLESLIRAPRNLWHPVLILIDEAQVFVPEKGDAISAKAVIDLCARGRKRGFAALLATPRLSDVAKAATSNCRNRLIGGCTEDIDRKRAGESLGFYTRESIRGLADLELGEFWVFGPALSNKDVVKVKVGKAETSPPEAGFTGKKAVVTKSSKLTAALAKLAELPKEAAEEAKTLMETKKALADARRELAASQRHICAKVAPPVALDPKVLERAVAVEVRKHVTAFKTVENGWRGVVGRLRKRNDLLVGWIRKFGEEVAALKAVDEDPGVAYAPEKITPGTVLTEADMQCGVEAVRKLGNGRHVFAVDVGKPGGDMTAKVAVKVEPNGQAIVTDIVHEEPNDKPLGGGEKIVLQAAAMYGTEGITKEHLTVQTSYKRSSRDTFLQRLSARGFIEVRDGTVYATPAGIMHLGEEIEILPLGEALREQVMARLGEGGEKKVLGILIEAYPRELTKDELSELTGYKRSSRDTFLQRLGVRKLIVTTGAGVRASEKLFD